MTEWEYEIVECVGTDFDDYGQRGWELISVDDGVAYFKRPATTKVPEYEYEVPSALRIAYKEMLLENQRD